MQIRVERPPELRGSPDEKLQLLYTYLFRLSENLGVVLNGAERAAGDVSSPGADAQLRAQLLYTEEMLRAELQAHEKEPVYPISVG